MVLGFIRDWDFVSNSNSFKWCCDFFGNVESFFKDF